MPFKLGPLELVLILVVILVVFGVGKLPQVGAAWARASVPSRKARATRKKKRQPRSPAAS
jgi:sec-independent protein translocase protein TatA